MRAESIVATLSTWRAVNGGDYFGVMKTKRIIRKQTKQVLTEAQERHVDRLFDRDIKKICEQGIRNVAALKMTPEQIRKADAFLAENWDFSLWPVDGDPGYAEFRRKARGLD